MSAQPANRASKAEALDLDREDSAPSATAPPARDIGEATAARSRAWPLISIIITNYNYEAFLPEAIDSVLKQTYAHVECIVVDDGSIDNSRDVLARYPNVTAIFQANGGQGSAIRTGCAAARGDIVMSLDADDFLYPHACQTIADHWAPGVKCLNFRLEVYHNDKKAGYCYPSRPFSSNQFELMDRNGYYPSAPMSGNAFELEYVRYIMKHAVHLDKDGADAYLLFCAPAFGAVASIDRPLAGYRMHGSNISMSSFKKTESNLSDHVYYQFWAQQNFRMFARGHGLPVRDTKYVQGAYNRMWHLWVSDGCGTARQVAVPDRRILCLLTTWSFASEPGLEWGARIKNVLFGLASLALPKNARLKIQRRFMEYEKT